jgi:hypothetical protein
MVHHYKREPAADFDQMNARLLRVSVRETVGCFVFRLSLAPNNDGSEEIPSLTVDIQQALSVGTKRAQDNESTRPIQFGHHRQVHRLRF